MTNVITVQTVSGFDMGLKEKFAAVLREGLLVEVTTAECAACGTPIDAGEGTCPECGGAVEAEREPIPIYWDLD